MVLYKFCIIIIIIIIIIIYCQISESPPTKDRRSTTEPRRLPVIGNELEPRRPFLSVG